MLNRVRFIHGRIGNPGCIQVDIDDGDPDSHADVDHFKALWQACFRGLLASAQAGDYVLFVPELPSPRIYYARLPNNRGTIASEESDR